jgi:microcystin-dependent protein
LIDPVETYLKNKNMKTMFTTIAILSLSALLLAQSPEAFKYQAVVRSGSGDVISETTVSLQVSILQGSDEGTPVYVETFAPITNAYGLISVDIGTGTVESGDFAAIDWSGGPYFIKSEMDPEGGTSYTDLGAEQLMSVPYALYASVADSAVNVFDGDYNSLVNTPDFAGWDMDASDDFSGNYNDLAELPNWSDSIAAGLDSAIFLTGTAEADNLISYDGVNWVAKDILLGNTGDGQAINNMPPYLALNYCIALQGIFPSRDIADPFIGTIGIFGFNFPPRGWAQCDGHLLSISQNQALFSLLGTMYGGDGRTTFALPDLRGRVALHKGNGPGLPSYMQGQKGGSATISIGVANLPPHTHTIVFE